MTIKTRKFTLEERSWLIDKGIYKSEPLEEVADYADGMDQQDMFKAFIENCRSSASDGILSYEFSAPDIRGGTPFDGKSASVYIVIGASVKDANIRLIYTIEHYPIMRGGDFITRVESDERSTNQIDQVAERLRTETALPHRIERVRWSKAEFCEGSNQKLNHILRGVYSSLPQHMMASDQSLYLEQGGK